MKKLSLFAILFFLWVFVCKSQILINHTSTNITKLSESEINLAKSTLHIAYGHTSHGSQLTDGMNGLIAFANGGGKGLKLSKDIFKWNNGGSSGALDLHDYAMDGDVGYYPDWVNNTRNYLNNKSNSNVNVIMWSWCGQVSGKYADGTLFSHYLQPMSQLEKDYPKVKFVYMTGHLDHWDDANNKAANDSIRRYCLRGKKILYDFADIESYNPDGKFFEFAGDDCSYYKDAKSSSPQGNWAEEWRATHKQNTDWYDCGSAHSDALNANQKAYAAWKMFAEIAQQLKTGKEEQIFSTVSEQLFRIYPNPTPGPVSIEIIQNPESAKIEIINLSGEILYRTNSPACQSVQCNLSHLNKGIYLVRVKNGLTQETSKLIIR